MESNKINVKIFGQEYVLAGEQPKEQIVRIAEYVDAKMREVEHIFKGGTPGSLAVLAAINVAEEYFAEMETSADLRRIKAELEKDVQHSVQMWEDAKRSFQKYKEDMQDQERQKEGLQNQLAEKDREMAALRKKMSEIEGNFFDLQMENVQLKSELERFKKIMV